MRVWSTITLWAMVLGCTPSPPASTPPSGTVTPQAAGGFNSPYFPFETGKRLVYQLSARMNDQIQSGQVVYDVVEASSSRARVQVTTMLNGQSQAVMQRYQLLANGVVEVTTETPSDQISEQPATQTYDPSMLEPGRREEGPQGAVMTTALDTVVVPAGTFEAVKLSILAPEGKGLIETWYARGIGLIKTASQFQQEGQTAQSLLELSEY